MFHNRLSKGVIDFSLQEGQKYEKGKSIIAHMVMQVQQ